jgi:hypothetical protein
MKSTFRTAAACAAMLTMTVATAAWARAERPDHRAPSPQFQAMREAHQRQKAQDLRTILRLRPDQEPALSAFLQARKPPMPAGDRHGLPAEAMTTPQRLDAMARREAAHAQARQRHTDAIRTFYAALSPDQRQVFDALQRSHSRRGHGFGGPRGRHKGAQGGPWRG